jgi:hypothetical protein
VTSDRPTIPAPRVRANVQRLRRLACAIWQLADALDEQQPGEIAERVVAALSGEIEHYVGRLAVALGLRWATGERQGGEGEAEQGAESHSSSVGTATGARGCAP